MAQTFPARYAQVSGAFSLLSDRVRVKAAYYFTKRLIDILVSSVVLVLSFPFMVVIGILVMLDSPGPAVYSQKRIGCKHRWSRGHCKKEVCLFTFYKFRSMYHKVDDRIHREFIYAYIHNDLDEMARLKQCNEDHSNQFKLVGDKRITRLGRFLRKSSMDELPQFWNILKGDMSLVGPRPAIPYEVEMYEPWHMQRLSALPGLTGLWQVTARNSSSFDEMVHLDLEYISKQSLWFDLLILLKTPLAVIDRKCD